MAANQGNYSNIPVTFIQNDLAMHILQNLGKINCMLFENSCSGKFSRGSDDKLWLSFNSQLEYSKTFNILNGYIEFSNPQFSQIFGPPPPQPAPTSAEIELDKGTHHYTASHLEEINQLLMQQFGNQVNIEESSDCNIKISGSDMDEISSAFSFLKDHLEKIHLGNQPRHSDQNSDEQAHPILSEDTDTKSKKWFIPEETYENYQMEIDAIFNEHGIEYTKQVTSSNSVMLVYEGISNVVDKIKMQLDAIKNKFDELKRQYATPVAQPRNIPSSHSDLHYSYQIDSHYSYQIEDGTSESQSISPPEQPHHPIPAPRPQSNPFNKEFQQSNPFYEDIQESNPPILQTDSTTPAPNYFTHPPADGIIQESTKVPQDQTSENESTGQDLPSDPQKEPAPHVSPDNAPNSPNLFDFPTQIPHQTSNPQIDPNRSEFSVQQKPQKEKRENTLSKALKGNSAAPDQPPIIPTPLNTPHQEAATSPVSHSNTVPKKRENELNEAVKRRSIDPTPEPRGTTSFNDPQQVDAIYNISQEPSSQTRTRNRENELKETFKEPPNASPPAPVSTSSFNDPQVVNAISTISQDTSQPTPHHKYSCNDTAPGYQDQYSHQSLDAIIQFHDRYACVVKLPEGSHYEDAKRVEQSLLNLKVVRCPNQQCVVTLIADEKEIVKCALKELCKKFDRLGYLPPCNGIPIMTEAVKSFVHVDDKPNSKHKTLASLTCNSGISIMLKHMSLESGNWDAILKSADSNSISSTRLENVSILDVVGRNVDSRRLAETAQKLDNWCFYVTHNKRKFSKKIIHLVLPGWNPVDFKGNHFKQSINLILGYCNKNAIKSIAFPVIGHESKKIPIPLSAQALLQGIDEFSINTNSSSLRQIDIIITRDIHIRSFLYHFVTPIQNQIKQTYSKKMVASEDVSEEEDNCPICLQPLDSDMPVRRLTKCKHEFHDLCITRAIELKPICPLCTTPLGVQQGNQPSGGLMKHNVTFMTLSGYHDVGTITISYHIPGGVQNESHPNPGVAYPPTSRTAYLPDNEKGNKVLGLLEVAFDRGLTFTVGTSRTLGVDNMVTWNDIHHKTSVFGTHGYPDDEYLDRVLAELKDKGVQ